MGFMVTEEKLLNQAMEYHWIGRISKVNYELQKEDFLDYNCRTNC